jgi:aspartyl-tRNA(Asn)/glutamyl-tRNA(Gln) amidotransferase subunit C
MKEKIDREQVRYIAHLSRLKLTEEEEEKFTRQLREILAYVDKLKELDTTSVPPTSHVLPLNNIFREDKKGNSLSPEEALANAPRHKYGHFQVPKIIE